MKCWRCGRDIADDVSECICCGADQHRTKPVTKIGRAMRILYDYYGAETILSPGSDLESRISDLADISNTEQNNLHAAMEAGAGSFYLKQLKNGNGSDKAFAIRVRTLMTEQAGLSEHEAELICGYFDEMIGWTPFVPEPASGDEAMDHQKSEQEKVDYVPTAAPEPEKRVNKDTTPKEDVDVPISDGMNRTPKKEDRDHKMKALPLGIGSICIAVIVLICILINHQNAQKRLYQQQTETAVFIFVLSTQEWLAIEASAETQQAQNLESTRNAFAYAQTREAEALQATQTAVVQTQEIINWKSTQTEIERIRIILTEKAIEPTETPSPNHIQVRTSTTAPEPFFPGETEIEENQIPDETEEGFGNPYQDPGYPMGTGIPPFRQPRR